MIPIMRDGAGSVRADLSKFAAPQPIKPMLARDADSVYWMSRYMERAEHVARSVLMKLYLLADCGELEPELNERLWLTLPSVMRCGKGIPAEGEVAPSVARFFTFDRDNPNSLINCLSYARENARGIREHISAEMWEAINALYLSVSSDDAPQKYEESPDSWLRSIMTGSMLFQGLTDQTLAHDQKWHFALVGKLLERADFTARFLEVHWMLLTAIQDELETPIRNINWMSVLRSCCSIEAYRKLYIGDMDPLRVAQFLILERAFPRTLRFAVDGAAASVTAIRSNIPGRPVDTAERTLGRLQADLEYAEMGEILAEGLPKFLQRIQSRLAEAAMEIQKSYFLY
jgi:uncharacterized alpha-E superfamily protein